MSIVRSFGPAIIIIAASLFIGCGNPELKKAEDLINTKRYEEARETLKALAETEDPPARTFLLLGRIDLLNGRPENAVEHLDRFIRMRKGKEADTVSSEYFTALKEIFETKDGLSKDILETYLYQAVAKDQSLRDPVLKWAFEGAQKEFIQGDSNKAIALLLAARDLDQNAGVEASEFVLALATSEANLSGSSRIEAAKWAGHFNPTSKPEMATFIFDSIKEDEEVNRLDFDVAMAWNSGLAQSEKAFWLGHVVLPLHNGCEAEALRGLEEYLTTYENGTYAERANQLRASDQDFPVLSTKRLFQRIGHALEKFDARYPLNWSNWKGYGGSGLDKDLSSRDWSALEAALVPEFVDKLPDKDPWGSSLFFRASPKPYGRSSQAIEYLLVSSGKDREFATGDDIVFTNRGPEAGQVFVFDDMANSNLGMSVCEELTGNEYGRCFTWSPLKECWRKPFPSGQEFTVQGVHRFPFELPEEILYQEYYDLYAYLFGNSGEWEFSAELERAVEHETRFGTLWVLTVKVSGKTNGSFFRIYSESCSQSPEEEASISPCIGWETGQHAIVTNSEGEVYLVNSGLSSGTAIPSTFDPNEYHKFKFERCAVSGYIDGTDSWNFKTVMSREDANSARDAKQ